jgi:Ca2+-binding RTX toxin-like protein
MAVIFAQLSKALDLLETAISSALVPTIVVRSSSEIILSFDHGFVDEIYGTGFFWDDETGVSTGTIDRIVERREGELTFTISEISVPLESLLTWFEQGDWRAFNQYILNRADLVIGSDSGDRLHTFAGNDIVVANGGDDEIDAGSGNDYIDAGSGDDSVYAGDGNDSLDGGVGGADELFGGNGNDTVSHASSGQGVIVDLQAQSTWDGVASDRLDSIENAIGSRFDDQIWGNNGDNVLDGGAGGSDDLFGRGGNDAASYASSGQGVIVDLQAQSTWDGVASDRLEGIENAIGSRFDDQIWGNEGDNVLDGGAGGSDDLFGGAGNDTANYGSSDRGVAINLDGQRTWDGLYTDRLQGIENATGSAFADVIYGSSQSNKFTGGAGADLFVLGSSWGHDEISDFNQGEDKIQISVDIFTTFDDLMNSIYSANDYTVIQADPNNTLTFGIAAHLLSSSDFLFV